MAPFDVKELEKRLKDKGLVAVEGLAEILVKEVFGWAKDSCVASQSPLLKIAGPILDVVLPYALQEVDKIDGIPG